MLGAGASVDYELPTWDKLGVFIEQKVNEGGDKYSKYGKEILSWMSKVGESKEYDTIDRCITKESRSKEHRSNGLTIENNIFLIMKDIFKELYKYNEDGWVNKLNQKILDSSDLEHRIAFVNYNYDNVLDENFLFFDYLTQKDREVDYRERRGALRGRSIPIFYPHGNLFSESELKNPSNLDRHLYTKKTELENFVDAISCHESEMHNVYNYGNDPIKLYILGLGGGLEVNLSNIDFKNHPISEIHITITDKSKKEGVVNFLSENYGVPSEKIKIHTNCNDLVEKSFGS